MTVALREDLMTIEEFLDLPIAEFFARLPNA